MLFGKKNSEPPKQKPAELKAPDVKVAAQQGAQTAALSPEDAKKRSMADKQLAAAFGEIVLLFASLSQLPRTQ